MDVCPDLQVSCVTALEIGGCGQVLPQRRRMSAVSMTPFASVLNGEYQTGRHNQCSVAVVRTEAPARRAETPVHLRFRR